MIYGKYKYLSHKFNSLDERHAELFITVSIREFSEICLSRKPYTSLLIRASNPSVLFSTNMLLAIQYIYIITQKSSEYIFIMYNVTQIFIWHISFHKGAIEALFD